MFSLKNLHSVIISGFLFLTFTVNSTFAADITKNLSIYEVGLAVPWKHLDSVLRAEFPSERVNSYDYENLTLEAQEVPFHIPHTNIIVLFNLMPGEFRNLNAAWNMHSVSVKIQTSPFKVEKVFRENVGGVIVNVRLAAECQGITLLQQNAEARVGVALSANGSDVQSNVNELTLKWNENWWVDNIVCQGPRGFGELISNELRTQLAQPTVVEALVKDVLHEKLQTEIQALVTKAMVPQVIYGEGANPIVLKYKKVESLNDAGLLVVADIDVPDSEAASAGSLLHPLVLNRSDLEKVGAKPVLFLPKAAVVATAQSVLKQYIYRGDLTNFEGFQDLMGSRFVQFFVWPDLRKYPKTAKFPFQSRMQQIASMTFDKGLKVKLSGTVESWVQSERGGAKWNYLYVNSPLTTEATMSIANGELQLTLKDTKLKSKDQMFPEYITRFKPSKSISTSIIDSAIKSSVLEQGLKVGLPAFTIRKDIYKATKIQRSSNENFAVEF